MKNLPKISIVIPSLNKGEFIGETLQSIINQKYPNLEVIIRDGGSTDTTVEIIKRFVSKCSYIHWESKKDEGQLMAINRGLAEAKGEIVTFLNADDVYQEGALGVVGAYFSKHPKILWLAGKGETIDEYGRKIAPWVDDYKNFLLKLNKYSWLLTANYFFQPSVFLSSKAFEKYGPFTGTETSVMEYDMWLKLGKVEMPKVLDRPLSSFRLTKGSLSTSEFKSILMADEKIAEKYTANPLLLALHYLHNIGRVLIVKYLIWGR